MISINSPAIARVEEYININLIQETLERIQYEKDDYQQMYTDLLKLFDASYFNDIPNSVVRRAGYIAN